MGDPTGEASRAALKLDFERCLLLQFRGSTITSDVGCWRVSVKCSFAKSRYRRTRPAPEP